MGLLDPPAIALGLRGAPGGVGSLDASARSPIKEGSFPTGIHGPSDWGRNPLGGWKISRAAAATRQVNVVWVGDSLSEGYESSNLLTKGYVQQIFAALQAAYGDGGSGFHSVIDTPTFTISPGLATIFTITGSWTMGSYGMNDATLIGGGIGATLSDAHVRGTTVDVFYQNVAGTGGFTVTIDGVLKATVVDPTIFAPGTLTIGGLAPGTHTVVITQTGANGCQISGLCGRNATGIVGWNFSRWGRSLGIGGSGEIFQDGMIPQTTVSSGNSPLPVYYGMCGNIGAVGSRQVGDVVFNSTTTIHSATANWQAGEEGKALLATDLPVGTVIQTVVSPTQVTASQAATASASGQAMVIVPPCGLIGTPGNEVCVDGWAGIPQANVPDLFICSLGGNDTPLGTVPATVYILMHFLFQMARRANPYCDLMWELPLLGQHIDGQVIWPELSYTVRQMCEMYGAMFVNLWPIARNVHAPWQALGGWGDGASDGAGGTMPGDLSDIHWSDAGHTYAASIITPLLTAA